MKIFDSTLSTLERSLDARLARHEVLAGNLANANTPGFTARDIDFEKAMAAATPAAVAGTGAPAPVGDIPLTVAGASLARGSSIVDADGASRGLDGNGVDVDKTLTAIAENGLQYGATARAVQKKLAMLRYAASDGSGA